MSGEVVRRVLVWSSLTRTLHWAMTLCVLALIASGWAMIHAPRELGAWAAELHRNTGYLLLAALAARAYLLVFGQGAESWRDLIPWPPQHRAALQMLRFYLTLGRAPLPGWYAHNPLWGPVYLALYTLLAVQGITGLAGLIEWHAPMLTVFAAFTVAHVLAVFVQDWKGAGADVSAMINGHRVFLIKRADSTTPSGVQVVPAASLLERKSGGPRGMSGHERHPPGGTGGSQDV